MFISSGAFSDVIRAACRHKDSIHTTEQDNELFLIWFSTDRLVLNKATVQEFSTRNDLIHQEGVVHFTLLSRIAPDLMIRHSFPIFHTISRPPPASQLPFFLSGFTLSDIHSISAVLMIENEITQASALTDLLTRLLIIICALLLNVVNEESVQNSPSEVSVVHPATYISVFIALFPDTSN